jgi:patatin-like phospholipase/acyl hydrolase
MADPIPAKPFRVLALDGGGAKGFYTLGVLKELEALAGTRLHEAFDLIFGTSTGSIIAALLCLGKSVDEIDALYRQHVVGVMRHRMPWKKSKALSRLAADVFGAARFEDMQTRIGIVATNWHEERPYIFKADAAQAHGRKQTFIPGFGVSVAEAVKASCSAYPFFSRLTVTTSSGERFLLADGGYCANNPALYAIADAAGSLNIPRDAIRVVSVGVDEYPPPHRPFFSVARWMSYLFTGRLLQKVMEINTQSMEQLRDVLFSDIQTVRISERYTEPEMATDMFEYDMAKLGRLYSKGRQSFGRVEAQLRTIMTEQKMTISDQQLLTWSAKGADAQSQATYGTIRMALLRADAPYASKSYTVYLQGSYGNDTNVYRDSDVDVVICTSSVYYSDTSDLSREEKARFESH